MQRNSAATAKGSRGRRGQVEVIAARQAKAIELRKAGSSFRQIARVLECDASTAYRDVQAALRETITLRDGDAEEYRELELQRLDLLMRSLMPKVIAGDAYAADVARKIGESRRKLLGLDAPTKVAPTTPDGAAAFDAASNERLARFYGDVDALRESALNEAERDMLRRVKAKLVVSGAVGGGVQAALRELSDADLEALRAVFNKAAAL